MGAVGLSVPASTRSSKPSLAFWVSLLGGWQGGAVRTKSETDLRGGISACPCKGLKSLSLPFPGDSGLAGVWGSGGSCQKVDLVLAWALEHLMSLLSCERQVVTLVYHFSSLLQSTVSFRNSSPEIPVSRFQIKYGDTVWVDVGVTGKVELVGFVCC